MQFAVWQLFCLCFSHRISRRVLEMDPKNGKLRRSRMIDTRALIVDGRRVVAAVFISIYSRFWRMKWGMSRCRVDDGKQEIPMGFEAFKWDDRNLAQSIYRQHRSPFSFSRWMSSVVVVQVERRKKNAFLHFNYACESWKILEIFVVLPSIDCCECKMKYLINQERNTLLVAQRPKSACIENEEQWRWLNFNSSRSFSMLIIETEN